MLRSLLFSLKSLDLKKTNYSNVKRLIDVGTYKGMRHKKGLPVNGQNTKINKKNLFNFGP